MKHTSIIITAGGLGKRMESSIPKQFLDLNGKPILMWTLEKFYQFNESFELILTLPEDWVSFWDQLKSKHNFGVPHKTVAGGEQRSDSVKNGLAVATGEIISIHDGVRPLIDESILKSCLEAVNNHDAVIPVIPLTDSVRKKDNGQLLAVNRNDYLLVQTPQCFQSDAIKKAYASDYDPMSTDDATIVEEAGYSIHTIPGNPSNIKITTDFDLAIAGLYLK